MTSLEYWTECVSQASDECGLVMTPEQLRCVSESVLGGHENYEMAFYSPPDGDRIAEIEREWKSRYEQLEREAESDSKNAFKAIRRAAGLYEGIPLSVDENGDVFRHDGLTEQVRMR